MSLDVSEAIDLAKDLLKTSGEYRAHDPDIAEQFAERAFEICDDLGIDRNLIGELSVSVIDEPAADDDDDKASAFVEMSSEKAIDEESQESSQQLRDLLQQQARVLQNARETEGAEPQKPSKWSLKLFGRANEQGFGGLQSASA